MVASCRQGTTRCLHRQSSSRSSCSSCTDKHFQQRDERVLVVWAYNFDDIIPTVRDFEDKLLKLLLLQRSAYASLSSSAAPSTVGSAVNLNEKATQIINETEVEAFAKEKEENSKRDHDKRKKKRSCGFGYFVSAKEDIEKTADGSSARPIRLFAPFYGGFAAALSLCEYPHLDLYLLRLNRILVFMGSGISVMIEESVLDGTFTRFALLVTTPFLFCVSLVCLSPLTQTQLQLTHFDSSSRCKSFQTSACGQYMTI